MGGGLSLDWGEATQESTSKSAATVATRDAAKDATTGAAKSAAKDATTGAARDATKGAARDATKGAAKGFFDTKNSSSIDDEGICHTCMYSTGTISSGRPKFRGR